MPPTGINVPFKFLRRGIKYSELSPEEQLEYEEKFFDEETGEIPDEINAAALNRWLFNQDTVDQALEILMEKGLKIAGGDRLGKTIIFARNHQHAEYIVSRFDYNYPHYKGAFARVIDSHDRYAQSILDDFSELDKEPTIAVSVDMLDTGVDVPEVLNLLFFKPVYSEVKFNQMIGRGTRLCENLFGVGEHKTKFLIFDLCDNFSYFEQKVKEVDNKPTESLNTRILKARLDLQHLLGKKKLTDSEHKALKTSLLDHLHLHVATMETHNFLVRRHLKDVETFSQRKRWNKLTSKDLDLIRDNLTPLPNGLPRENPDVKKFDLLCLQVQLAILKKSYEFELLRDKIRDLLSNLEEKQTIPAVKQQLSLITEAQEESWWTDVTPAVVESLRLKIRDLIQFIDRQETPITYTNFKDQVWKVSEASVPYNTTGFSPYQYRKKVEAYIRANQDHIAIAKLKRNIALTESDLSELEKMLFTSEEIENRDRFEEVYGKDLSLKSFIRQLVGLDRNSAKEAFAVYLQNANLTANQVRFIEQIIDWLTQHGVMNPHLLYEPPFTDIHTEGLDGVFNDDDADNIIAIVRSFNDTAEMTFIATVKLVRTQEKEKGRRTGILPV